MADALGGITVSWIEALPIYEEAFEKVTAALTGAGYRIGKSTPVGSFLRRDPECRDLDILIEIIDTPTGTVEERFGKTIGESRKSLLTLLNETKHLIEPIFEKPITSGLAVHGLLHDLQVDVFLCTPTNWVGSCTVWTGDRVHNMFKFSKARAKGLTIWPWGVVDNKTGEIVHFDRVNDLLQHIDIVEKDFTKWSWRKRHASKHSGNTSAGEKDPEGSNKGEGEDGR